MNKVLTGLRIFLGIFLLANGINFWFQIVPIGRVDNETANRLMDGLVYSGLFEFVKFVEIGSGLLLLANRFVPMALALMLPLTIVIMFVDMVLINDLRAWIFALLLAIPQFALMLAHLRSYLPVLIMRNTVEPISIHEIRSTILS